MSDIQRIVTALELAIKDATFQERGPHTSFFSKPPMIDRIDGDVLRASIQTIINLYKEEPNALMQLDIVTSTEL